MMKPLSKSGFAPFDAFINSSARKLLPSDNPAYKNYFSETVAFFEKRDYHANPQRFLRRTGHAECAIAH